MLNLEKKVYDKDSTPEELEAIRASVYMHSEKVVYWKEAPVMSVWQVEQFGIKLLELTKDLEHFNMIIDLRQAKPPNSWLREALRNVYMPLAEKGILEVVSVFTGKNFMINVAVKLVLGTLGFKSFSVHSKQEDAEKALKNYA